MRPGVGDRVRKAANRRALRVCQSLSGESGVITHPWLSVRQHSLYRRDGVHLSDAGNTRFRLQLQQAILQHSAPH